MGQALECLCLKSISLFKCLCLSLKALNKHFLTKIPHVAAVTFILATIIMALNVLASLAPVERLVSVAGKVFRPDQCRLTDDAFQKLISSVRA